MNRRLLRLLYLVRNNQPHPTTNNASRFMNRIPCAEEDYFRLPPAELHVQREMQDYPRSQETQGGMDQHVPGVAPAGKTSKLFDLVMNFSVELDYLEIEEARLWLKGLNGEEIKRNWSSFEELVKCVTETLGEKEYDEHVIRSAMEFIQELKATQEKLSSKVI